MQNIGAGGVVPPVKTSAGRTQTVQPRAAIAAGSQTDKAPREGAALAEGAFMRKLQRAIVASIATLVAFVGLLVATPEPASAYPYGNAYLVVNNWRCVGGGNVVAIYGSVDSVWTGGDAGDNIIYARVDLNRTNTFNGRALCDRPWYDPRGDYWINVVWWQFTPSRTGQTFWY